MDYTALIDQYGYIVLFVGLMLELIIFGIPTEILMGYAGFLVYEGKLGLVPAILSAFIGSSMGITLSYFIGKRLGLPFFEKYGHKIHMGPDRLDKFSNLFGKYGNGLIMIAYFIPGVRHVTGYFSGISNLRYRRFATFSYLGALIWVSVFISLGKVLGPQWEAVHNEIKKYLIIGGLGIVFLIFLYYLYKYLKKGVFDNLVIINQNFSLRTKLSILSMIIIFITLMVFLIGLTQDYLAHETIKFNQLTILIIQRIFDHNFYFVLRSFSDLADKWVLLAISILTLIWILLLKRDRIIEISFFLITSGGGIILVKGLIFITNLINPVHIIIKGYPPVFFLNESYFLTLTIWGFFAYIAVQQTGGFILPSIATGFFLIITILLGISHILLKIEPPSTIITGVVLAGIWLSLNMILLDIYRELRRIK